MQKFSALDKITNGVNAVIERNGRCVIAIDGRCGAGKSTIAGALGELFSASIVRLDDFFLPPEKRSQILSQTVANLDVDRFYEEVVLQLYGQVQSDFSYRIFDCKTACFSGEKFVKKTPVIICEGTYSLHPRFRDAFDTKVFVTCTSAVQEHRILSREGELRFANFRDKWIPLEEEYFRKFAICDCADYLIDTTKNQ